MTRLLTLLVLMLGLSACGFHLREPLVLPPDMGPVRVVARDPYSPLAESLRVAAERAGATLAADDVVDGVATLRIQSEVWASLPISVDQYGRSQEYTLRYATVFSVERADGSTLIPKQVIELARDYISVPTRSTGTESEKELLTREMRKDMTAAILRRLDARLRQPAGNADADTATVPADALPATDVPNDPALEPVLDQPADVPAPATNPVVPTDDQH